MKNKVNDRGLRELYRPKNLKIEELKEKVPVTFSGFHNDKVYYICDAIYKGSIRLDENTLTHPNKKDQFYIPIHSNYIKQFLVAEYYNQILEWMQCAGIIESDHSYEVDVVSTGYRFTPRYRNDSFEKLPIENYVMYGKVPKKKDDEQHRVPESRTVNKLKRWYDGLTLDIEKAQQIVANVFINKALSVNKMETWHEIELEHRNNNLIIDLFRDPAAYHFQDSSGRRLHTVITRTPKYLRSLITYKGEELAQTDIRASQLFFTLHLLKEENWKKNRRTKGDIIWNGLESINIFPSCLLADPFVSNSNMCSESDETQAGKGFQDDMFLQMVTRGDIYSFFISKMSETDFFKPGMSYEQKREKIKRLLIAQINGNSQFDRDDTLYDFDFRRVGRRNRRTSRRKSEKKMLKNKFLYSGAGGNLWKAFESFFPGISAIYEQIKMYDNADLSKVLQRIESTAVLDFACATISRLLPDVPIFTIHDCIVTTKSNIEKVDKLLRQAVAGYIGYEPQTEIKYWSEYKVVQPFDDYK